MGIAEQLRERVVAYERRAARAEIGIRAVDTEPDDPHRLLGIADGLRQAADALDSLDRVRAVAYLEASAGAAKIVAGEQSTDERRAYFEGLAEGAREALALLRP